YSFLFLHMAPHTSVSYQGIPEDSILCCLSHMFQSVFRQVCGQHTHTHTHTHTLCGQHSSPHPPPNHIPLRWSSQGVLAPGAVLCCVTARAVRGRQADTPGRAPNCTQVSRKTPWCLYYPALARSNCMLSVDTIMSVIFFGEN